MEKTLTIFHNLNTSVDSLSALLSIFLGIVFIFVGMHIKKKKSWWILLVILGIATILTNLLQLLV